MIPRSDASALGASFRDVLAEYRIFKKQMGHQKALDEIERRHGKATRAEVGRALTEVFDLDKIARADAKYTEMYKGYEILADDPKAEGIMVEAWDPGGTKVISSRTSVMLAKKMIDSFEARKERRGDSAPVMTLDEIAIQVGQVAQEVSALERRLGARGDAQKPYISKLGNKWQLLDKDGKVVKEASSMEALQGDLEKLFARRGDAERRAKPVKMAENEWLATLVEGGETVWEGSVYRSQNEAERAAREHLNKTRGDADWTDKSISDLKKQYQALLREQAAMPADMQWKLGEEIRNLVAQLKVAMEAAKAVHR